MAPVRGRPRAEDPKDERLFVRVTPQEKAEICAFAKSAGYPLLEPIIKGIEAVKTEKQEQPDALVQSRELFLSTAPERSPSKVWQTDYAMASGRDRGGFYGYGNFDGGGRYPNGAARH